MVFNNTDLNHHLRRRHVAIHCVDEKINKTYVYFAKHQWSDWSGDWFEIEVPLTGITLHPNYDFPDYDYALVELPTPLNFSESWKICLPESCDDGCAPGTLAYVSGWGRLGYELSVSDILQSAFVEMHSNPVCAPGYINGTVTDRVICAGPLDGGVGTRRGDSGGPLMTIEDGYYKLCGVTSFGPLGYCAAPNVLCKFANKYFSFYSTCSLIFQLDMPGFVKLNGSRLLLALKLALIKTKMTFICSLNEI